MNIFIDGIGTHNKGAELMLYAVLQELERKLPNANVLLPRIINAKLILWRKNK